MRVILFFIMIWGVNICQGQIVPSSCIAHDSIVEKYLTDADQLTLRKIYRNGLTYIDSVQIPTSHSDTVLNALLAVYNATALPERDTVVNIYDIHSFPEYTLDNLMIRADSNLYWMEELKLGNLNTGHPIIDELTSVYQFDSVKYTVFNSNQTDRARLYSDSNYNTSSFLERLDTIQGVAWATLDQRFDDGNNIWDSIYSNHVELIYSIGWEGCHSTCIYRRYWKFNVTFDCNVEFVESYGDDVSMGIPNQLGQQPIKVLPNPFTYYVKIEGINQFDYQLFSSTGQLVIQGSTSNGEVRELEWLDSGIYFLRVNHQGKIHQLKLVKGGNP